MTATEALRRMLDERGVEWHDTKIGKGFITVFEHDGITWVVTEHSSRRLSVKGCVKPTQGHYNGMTPEQAVEATLGDADATGERQRDAVQVVRCRDCKYCMSYWKSDYCDYFSHVTNDPDGFCAWGERRES